MRIIQTLPHALTKYISKLDILCGSLTFDGVEVDFPSRSAARAVLLVNANQLLHNVRRTHQHQLFPRRLSCDEIYDRFSNLFESCFFLVSEPGRTYVCRSSFCCAFSALEVPEQSLHQLMPFSAGLVTDSVEKAPGTTKKINEEEIFLGVIHE